MISEDQYDEMIIRAKAIELILNGRVEEALKLLSEYYSIKPPRIRIGLPRKCYKALACYLSSKKTIYLRSSEEYRNPFIILHEFYHHLRTFMGKHRGTERYADRYAAESILFYKMFKSINRRGDITR